jgi:glycosyltransferase involved in cell wall biosynthesis
LQQKNIKKKVCLLTDHHICFNPRLWKEAFFYESKGFEVVILSMWISKEFLQKDLEILKGHSISYKTYLSLVQGEVSKIAHTYYRLRKRMAGELQRRFNIGTRWAISYAPGMMITKALKEDADLYAAHLECAFFAGKKLIQAGRKVSFDFEDWYSRDFLVPERPVKLLESWEKFALNNGVFCTAASGAMAAGLTEFYSTDKSITVIYNGFSVEEENYNHTDKIIGSGEGLKLLWFSRSIGPDRGIESFLNSLAYCDFPVELHLLGKMEPGYQAILDEKFALLKKHRLLVHPFISHNRLLSFISQYEIGLAIDENINENRNLTITNKILQYLQAGLQVLASDTAGHRKVAAQLPDLVTIVDIKEPSKVVDALAQLMNKADVQKTEQRDRFNKIFSWEAQEKKLNSLLERNL